MRSRWMSIKNDSEYYAKSDWIHVINILSMLINFKRENFAGLIYVNEYRSEYYYLCLVIP